MKQIAGTAVLGMGPWAPAARRLATGWLHSGGGLAQGETGCGFQHPHMPEHHLAAGRAPLEGLGTRWQHGLWAQGVGWKRAREGSPGETPAGKEVQGAGTSPPVDKKRGHL